ncbi:MAG: J domain-containing protein [Rhodospirillales bacterium]
MRRAAQESALKAPFDSGHSAGRRCMHPSCLEAGAFRAPMSRDRLDQYYWFCLEHVRAYNAQWDFFKGMSTAQIEAELRADQTWQRPSWPLGANGAIHDPLGVLGQDQRQARAAERPLSAEEKALSVLGLGPGSGAGEGPGRQGFSTDISFTEIRARYKFLVKQLHPDANGGDRAAEERLKEVNRAYSTLKASYSQVA